MLQVSAGSCLVGLNAEILSSLLGKKGLVS